MSKTRQKTPPRPIALVEIHRKDLLERFRPWRLTPDTWAALPDHQPLGSILDFRRC